MNPIIVHNCDGSLVDLTNVQVEDINFEDILLTLSQMPRYGARTTPAYSVLQHSLLLSQFVPDKLKKQALTHDFAEFLLPDVPHAIKAAFPAYEELELGIWNVICTALNLDRVIDPEVWRADIEIREVEKFFLFPGMPDPGREHPYGRFIIEQDPSTVREIFRQKWVRL